MLPIQHLVSLFVNFLYIYLKQLQGNGNQPHNLNFDSTITKNR